MAGFDNCSKDDGTFFSHLCICHIVSILQIKLHQNALSMKMLTHTHIRIDGGLQQLYKYSCLKRSIPVSSRSLANDGFSLQTLHTRGSSAVSRLDVMRAHSNYGNQIRSSIK